MLLHLLLVAALAAPPADLADAAVVSSPDLASLEARARALEHRAAVAGSWMDPMLGVELSNLPAGDWALDGHPMAGLQVRAQATLPAPGTTRWRREVAAGHAERADLARDAAEVSLRAQVESAWWRLALSRRLAALTTTHLALTDDLLEVVRSRYEVGSARQHDLVRLEVRRGRLAEDLADQHRAQAEWVTALDRALADAATGTYPTPEALGAAAVRGTPEGWLAATAEHSPALAALRLDAENSREAARLARVEARPDLTLWAGWRVRTWEADGGTDLASLGASVPLPSGSLRRAAGQEASLLSQADAADLALEAATDALRARLETAALRWQRASERASTHRDVLIPSAREALEGVASDYRTGRVGFEALFQAQVDLLVLEQAALTSAAETRLQEVAVRAAIGAPIPSEEAP